MSGIKFEPINYRLIAIIYTIMYIIWNNSILIGLNTGNLNRKESKYNRPLVLPAYVTPNVTPAKKESQQAII